MYARLVELGERRISVRKLGGDRAGEVRISRFLRNPAVTVKEMVATAAARTCAHVAGRHVLAIQDTTTARADHEGHNLALHPVIAVDAVEGALLGLIDLQILSRAGGLKASRKARAFDDKESRRWLTGAEQAAALRDAGASLVTVIADREGDIYEDFALKPAGVEVLIRAGQDRSLANGSSLFAAAQDWPAIGDVTIAVPAAPGRLARKAVIALRFGTVVLARPKNRPAASGLPETTTLTLIEAREAAPPKGVEPAHWRLLTSHQVADLADARRIVGYYRDRWIIEQLFRTLKTKGFDIEALRVGEGGPLERLLTATLVAGVTVLMLVRDRDGTARRPITDAFDPEDMPVLATLCKTLEGKTAKQKNPHPPGSLAFAAWVMARLGGWTGYYGKPGPVVMLDGLTQFHAIKHGWNIRDV